MSVSDGMRNRVVAPGFFDDEKLCHLSAYHRLLFVGLWCLADREGRLEDRPQYIKVRVFPYEDIDVSSLLDGLIEAGFIKRYVYTLTAQARRALEVVNFTKYQKIHPHERASSIPPLKDGEVPYTQLVTDCNYKSLQRNDKSSQSSGTSTSTSTSKDKNRVTHKTRDPISASGGRTKKKQPEASTPDASRKVIVRVSHEVLAQLGIAHPDVVEAVKARCAQLKIPYNSAVVCKAIESAVWQRMHKRPSHGSL